MSAPDLQSLFPHWVPAADVRAGDHLVFRSLDGLKPWRVLTVETKGAMSTRLFCRTPTDECIDCRTAHFTFRRSTLVLIRRATPKPPGA